MSGLLDWTVGLLPLLAIAAVPVAVTWVVRRRRGPLAGASPGLDSALVLTLVLLAVVGFRPGPGETPGAHWQLVPFLDLVRSLGESPSALRIEVANVLGNVALFVPWGVVVALRFPRARVATFIVVTLALSLTIEIGQAVQGSGRESDATDVVTNVAGGILGFLLVRRLARRAPADSA